MRKLINQFLLIIAILVLATQAIPVAQANNHLLGRILLAVERNGEAWYLSPVDQKRYYLGRPDDAFIIMRELALGISNSDFTLLEKKQLAPNKLNRLQGQILIKPEDYGRAYYLTPTYQLHYLGRPADAFAIMRNTALGITNQNLDLIPIGQLTTSNTPNLPTINPLAKTWQWQWLGQKYTISLPLNELIYTYFTKQPKVFTYTGSLPHNWQEQYYYQFLSEPRQQLTIKQIAQQLQDQAQQNQLSANQTAELAVAFIQSIPYDHQRNQLAIQQPDQAKPNYPYETLYLNQGVCADKALLGWLILKELGYGVALLSYDSINHMGLGIACPLNSANYNSGYCYIETTDFYRIGIIPNKIDHSTNQDSLTQLSWQLTDQFTNPKINQAVSGLVYTGLDQLKQLLEDLDRQLLISQQLSEKADHLEILIRNQNLAIQQISDQLNQLQINNQINQYNQIVPTYNQAIQDYEQNRQQYNQLINQYNNSIQQYNQLLQQLRPSQLIK